MITSTLSHDLTPENVINYIFGAKLLDIDHPDQYTFISQINLDLDMAQISLTLDQAVRIGNLKSLCFNEPSTSDIWPQFCFQKIAIFDQTFAKLKHNEGLKVCALYQIA